MSSQHPEPSPRPVRVAGRSGSARARSAADAELQRLNWALAAYARSASALLHSESLDELVDKVCKAVVANDVYILACVGLAETSAGQPFRLLGGAGPAIRYLDGLDLSWSEDEVSGSGPTGRAVRSGAPHLMEDSLTDPVYAPWREKGLAYGIRSSVTVPFKKDGQVIGALLVYASEPGAFGPDELAVFQQLGEELAFAISLEEERSRLAAAETARASAEAAARDALAELSRVARMSMLGELVASIAHEINQPLAAIVANCDASLRWLAREPPNVREAEAAIRRAIGDASRMSEVIARTRSMVVKQPFHPADFDLNEAVREVLLFTARERGRSGVETAAELDPDLPLVRGDRVQIQQVLLNLILNGVDAMRSIADRKPRLLVRTSALGSGEVRVDVEDRGVGLDPQTAERVFERFFTTKPGGTGLGLAISRSIVEAHGGRVWTSAAEPNGAIFSFTLPTAA